MDKDIQVNYLSIKENQLESNNIGRNFWLVNAICA